MNDLEGNVRMEESDNIEHLRLILERQQSRVVTREEASDIGESLIAFFEILGDESGALENEPSATSSAALAREQT